MNKRWLGGVVAVIALLVALGWWLGWFGTGEDPLIAQTRAIAETPRTEQTPAQQSALRDAWRDRMQGMDEGQRQAFFEQMMPIFMPLMMRQFENQYDKLVAMTPEQQRAELDKRIDEMQRRGGPGGSGGGGGGGGNRPNMDPKRAAEMQKKWIAYTTPEQRSKMDNGMKMFFNRMKERGLNPPQGPGAGFF